ncbi:MAG: GTPase [Pseudomonadota bacterium]
MAHQAQETRTVFSRVTDLWARLMASDEAPDKDARIVETALAEAPVIWMLGKVQAGKTSIVQTLTQSSNAEVGSGFKACTRTSRIFDFPPEAPLIRFLDTRGLGEAGYDAAEDMAECESRAHLIVATLRAMDPQQDLVVDVIKTVRARHPDWPVVVAQTCLHEGLPAGRSLPLPYPFYPDLEAGPRAEDTQAALPELMRALNYQRSLFKEVPGRGALSFVAIDFTQPEDGFDPPDYGREALLQEIATSAPDALVATLKTLQAASGDRVASRLRSQIVGHARVAAAVDVVPIAGALAVPAVQARLLKQVGDHFSVTWDRRTLGEFAACLGVGVVSRLLVSLGARQVVKLVPGYGQTIGAATAAATSFATTYALGQAATYYLKHRALAGFDTGDVRNAYADALKDAIGLAGTHTSATAKTPGRGQE